MHWRLDDLRSFLDVLDAGSVTAAAVRRNLAKSVVSKRIADLEVALGTALFQRRAGRIAPTETALRLAERVRPAIAELDAATEAAAWGLHGLRGRLAIAAPVSFGTLHLGPVVAEFARRHPELEIALDYDDRMVDLVREGYDVAVRIGAPRDTSLIARKLCEDGRAVCASPAYVAAHGAPATLDELARLEAIDYANVHAGRLWQFAGQPERPAVSVPMRARVVANNGEAMRDMAIAGLGVAILPLFIAAAPLADGRLVRLLPAVPTAPLPIAAVWPPAKPLAPKVRAFVDHLASAFGPLPPWRAPAANGRAAT
jgi:DNA-binding transcriptional LysR family regulator